MQKILFRSLVGLLSINCSMAEDLASWHTNYKNPQYFISKEPKKPTTRWLNLQDLTGFIFEIGNADDSVSMSYIIEALTTYLAQQPILTKPIINSPKSYIFFLEKNSQSPKKQFYKQFAQTVAWLMLNRQDTFVTIRPLFKDLKFALNPLQAIYVDPPQVQIGHHRHPFITPEQAITDGFHIHMDYLPGQEQKASALYDHFKEAMAHNRVIYSDLDTYPEKFNGPHLRAGWEVKFEHIGPLALENYGYALAWLMVNHGDIPIYSHSKSWLFGENEKRLISHLDNAVYSGVKPKLNQRFFYDPTNTNSGLYRWDSHLPIKTKLTINEQTNKQNEILTYWFGATTSDQNAQNKKWFNKQHEKQSLFDLEIKEKFARDMSLFVNHSYDNWMTTPKGSLAAIILLDQFPRNIYRGQRMAFAYDNLALHIAKTSIQKGFDKKLNPFERLFMYLPLEHSEDPEDQKLAVVLIQKLKQEAPRQFAEAFTIHYQMALKHKLTIDKFNYFPSRNANYGYGLSATEQQFMQENQADF